MGIQYWKHSLSVIYIFQLWRVWSEDV